MTENAPPVSAGANADGSRGMPYYEKLRRDLREALNRKRQLDREISGIEENISRTETQYLEETLAGNIIKGFDNYIKGSTTTGTTTGPGTSTRRKPTISDNDRIFSKSSTSLNVNDQSTPNSAQTTPSHAPTPASSFPSAKESKDATPTATSNKSGTNKKKKLEKEEEDDGKTTKRGKITYGRD